MTDLTQALAMFGPTNGASSTSPLTALLPFVVIFAIFYLLVFKPESTKRKNLEKKISMMGKDDKVTTSGGLIGTVANVKEATVTVKIADNVKVDVLKSAITHVEKKREEDEKIS